MRGLAKSLPKYRKHKPTGQAVVTLCGKDFYLGPHGTKASKTLYDQKIAEWLAGGRSIPLFDDFMTLAELIAKYWKFAKGYYVKNGEPTDELAGIKIALRFLKDLYGTLPVDQFGPLSLVAVRDRLIDAGHSRGYVNQNIGRIKRMYKWGVAQEFAPVEVYHRINTVDGLRKGKTKARETAPVLPVDDATVDKTIKVVVNPVVADMIKIQRLTGCRPGELMGMRPKDIDRSSTEGVWLYYPESHKMEHKGRARTIVIGPRAQTILAKYLFREETKCCFTRRCGKPFKRWHYARAIKRACKKAEVEDWAPNRLRHATATEIRKAHGLEGAQVVAGHSKADTTQIYAERDLQKAIQIMREVG